MEAAKETVVRLEEKSTRRSKACWKQSAFAHTPRINREVELTTEQHENEEKPEGNHSVPMFPSFPRSIATHLPLTITEKFLLTRQESACFAPL